MILSATCSSSPSSKDDNGDDNDIDVLVTGSSSTSTALKHNPSSRAGTTARASAAAPGFLRHMHTTGETDLDSSTSFTFIDVNKEKQNNNNKSFRRCLTTRFSVLHSTASHHQALPEEEGHFVGPYAHLRRTLDYSYHTYYRKERQWLQDCIIEDFLDPTVQQQQHKLKQKWKTSSSSDTTTAAAIHILTEDEQQQQQQLLQQQQQLSSASEPWFIHTVGAPGAGKRHVITKLVQEGKLPLLSSSSSLSSRYYVHVDPQEIRRRLPEYSSYVKKNHHHHNNNSLDVDVLTGKEAGQIMELLVRAGLQAGWNVVLDGSLSDTSWYQHVFYPMLKQAYPQVHFALLHITASRQVIMKRCKEVERWTHRHMPEERIDKILNQLPKSIECIKPLVDFYCQLDNDHHFGNNKNDDGIHISFPKDLSWKDFTNTFTPVQQQQQQEENIVLQQLQQTQSAKERQHEPQSTKEQQQQHQHQHQEQPSSEDKQPSILQRSPSSASTDASSSSTTSSSTCNSKTVKESIARAFQIMASKFLKKISFAPNLSSEQNYKASKSERGLFFGPYAHIRATLDYNYHEHYSKKRQILQDKIIDDMLNSAVITDKNGNVCTTPTEPWLVFTAGAMGAGKSYTMNRLVETGRFPLLAFVLVDPDEIRRHLPEYHIYVDENPELAGELTNKESGFIAEILTLAGLQAGKNVLVDGSLRDAQWYKGYMARLKKDYPKVKQAIIHVTAPREAVFQRAAARALATGRIVPKSVLENAIEQVPRSVQILGPLVDYFCEILNAPHQEDVQLLTEGETWQSFEQRWIQTCAWVPNKRSLLRPAQKVNAQLSVSTNGQRQEK